MPNNTLLLLGLGLAAWTLLRDRQPGSEESDLVTASMLSQGTGTPGKILGEMPTVAGETQITYTGDNAAVQTQPLFDINAWLRGLVGTTANGANGSLVVNEDERNERIGGKATVNVVEYKQTPEYIRTTGELAGTAIRQLGLTRGVDLINDKISIQRIDVADDGDYPRMEGLPTMDENVQIVAGGANPGDPYFTTIDFLIAAKDQGYFGGGLSGPEASARSNVFNPAAAAAAIGYQGSIEEPVNVTGGIPLKIAPNPGFRRTIDRYDVDTASGEFYLEF